MLLIATASAATAALAAPAVAQPAPKAAAGGSTTAENVIVLLKNQHASVPLTRANRANRSRILHSDQASVVRRARALGATKIHEFGTINAVSLTLSQAQVDHLAADPSVRAVVPDLVLRLPQKSRDTSARKAAAAPTPPAGVCPTDPTRPILEPEALQTMHVAYSNATVGAQNYTTGQGVKVAFLADGIDIDNPDFIRGGRSVFVDYKDFSTEGPNAPSSAAEAFGDASSIAAQGTQIYDLADYVNEAHPLPAGCTIKIRGVAPGADLVGLKVFGDAATAPTSRFIQAVEYAIADDVDVINESFGSNPYPDTNNDPLSIVNDAAIDAGITVVASTGDAGTTGTTASPATSARVIAVGATTMFRSARQIADGYTNLPGIKGWADDNIASLSSSGFAQNASVPDVVAPEDSGWALCTPNTVIYTDCADYTDTNHFAGSPSPIQQFGGTSQSSPLTAGTAALVISAYERAHPDAGRPSPSLVKRIITGTARNLLHPVDLQGSGEVDALAAVRAARTVATEHSSTQPSTATGSAFVFGKSQLDLSGRAGSTVSSSVTVTNVSRSTQKIDVYNRTFGAAIARETHNFTFDGPHIRSRVTDVFGSTSAYVKKTIKVGTGVSRLDAAIAYNGQGAYAEDMVLVDPNGIYTAHAAAQGLSNFAHVDARNPVAGTWSVYVIADPTLTTTVHWTATQRKTTGIGTVSTSTRTLAAGKSATLTASFPLPSNPGNIGAEIKVRSASGVHGIVPVSLRSVIVPSAAATSTFRRVITGGNGRDDGSGNGGAAQSNTYSIDVPAGRRTLAVGVTLDQGAAHPDAIYLGYLTAPDGQTQAAQSNLVFDPTGDPTTTNGLQLYVNRPTAGRWQFTLEATNPVAGDLVRQPFTGYVSIANQKLTAAATPLPHSSTTVIKKGTAKTVTVTVKNTGVVGRNFFLDPRQARTGTYTLASQVPDDDLSSETLPESDVQAVYLVPTRTRSLTITARADQNIQLDAAWNFSGDPEVFSSGRGHTASVTINASRVPQGLWSAQAGPIGPFAGPAPRGTVGYTATVRTRLFDDTVSTSTGSLWPYALIAESGGDADDRTALEARWARAGHRRTAAVTPTKAAKPLVENGPVYLAPGQSTKLEVRFVPTAAKGTVVSGDVYLDTFDFYQASGDEVVGLGYTYKVG